jgi:hypothetical protein
VSGPDSSTGGYLAPTSGPIEDDALLDLIQGAIVGITGITGQLVRPRWQLEPPDAPDVGTNWCAFGIVDRDQDTFGVEQWNPEAGNETVIRHETINILASFYGPGCDGLAMQLRDGLILAQNREALGGQGLEFISCGKPQRAPELIKSQWLSRTDLPLTLRREADRTYAVLGLLSANITAGVQTPTSTITEAIPVSSNEAQK